jgi:hypothetical protein
MLELMDSSGSVTGTLSLHRKNNLYYCDSNTFALEQDESRTACSRAFAPVSKAGQVESETWLLRLGSPSTERESTPTPPTMQLSWECRRHVADMSARHSDVGGLRQKRHVAATQDMKKETLTYPIHVNNSRQVQVSSNIRVSYPTIEFLCLSSKSNHVIADI